MANTYVNIASTTLSSSQATVTFSSISSSYTDLVLRISARTDRASAYDDVLLRINGNSAVSYSNTYLRGSGSTANSARNNISTSLAIVSSADGNNATASTYGSLEIYIPSYTVAQNHPISAFGVQEGNQAAMFLATTAGLARVASAITQIDISPFTGPNFISGSTFYLYGIKKT